MRTCYLFCLYFIFLCGAFGAQAQNTLPTERVITLTAQQQPPQQFLENISRQAKVQFSYNPQIFAGVAPLSLQLHGVTVREALFQAFGNAIKLKAKGNYIILQKTNLPIQSQQAGSRPLKVLISGYVIDHKTQQRLPNASIFEKKSLSATLSNAQGFFQILIETENQSVALSLAKVGYVPQTIDVPAQNIPFLNVLLEPLQQINALPTRDSLFLPARRDSLRIFDIFVPQPQRIHRQNLGAFFGKFLRNNQISLLPMVGTNHVLSGLVGNKVSFNIIGGYNAGVDGLEVGGVFNVNKGNVGKVQLAGAINAVSGKTRGLQVSGFMNIVRDSVKGVQIAGTTNATLQHIKGLQLGGALNVALGGVEGVQIAGAVNITQKQMQGVQVAGFTNIATGEMEGVQVSGFLNVAGKSQRGWQIGVFNYADSAHQIKQIGLVNFVRKGGYKHIELSTNEMLFTDLTIRSGTPYFYTLARVGVKYYPNRPFWHYGYGFGCRIKGWRTWDSNTELIAYHLLRTLGKGKVGVYENFGARYQLYFAKHLGKHFSIALAGAIDFCSMNKGGVDYEDARTLSSTVLSDIEGNVRLWRIAWGGTLGLRYRW